MACEQRRCATHSFGSQTEREREKERERLHLLAPCFPLPIPFPASPLIPPPSPYGFDCFEPGTDATFFEGRQVKLKLKIKQKRINCSLIPAEMNGRNG